MKTRLFHHKSAEKRSWLAKVFAIASTLLVVILWLVIRSALPQEERVSRPLIDPVAIEGFEELFNQVGEGLEESQGGIDVDTEILENQE